MSFPCGCPGPHRVVCRWCLKVTKDHAIFSDDPIRRTYCLKCRDAINRSMVERFKDYLSLLSV